MNVVVHFVRQIIVDDVGNRSHIDASANDIGRDKNLDGTASQRFENRIALRLVHVPMNRAEPHIRQFRDSMNYFFELVMKFGRPEFSSAKDNRLRWFFSSQQLYQDVKFAIRRDGKVTLFDSVNGNVLLRTVDVDRFEEIFLSKSFDFFVQSSAQEECLTIFRATSQDTFYIGSKADIEHSVGFVQHDAPNITQFE